MAKGKDPEPGAGKDKKHQVQDTTGKKTKEEPAKKVQSDQGSVDRPSKGNKIQADTTKKAKKITGKPAQAPADTSKPPKHHEQPAPDPDTQDGVDNP